MNADINTNKKFQAIIKELFIRCRILNITLVFIMQSYFSVLKDVRLNSAHYLIMKIHNKRELQNIGINHSADIDSKDFVKIYRKLVYIAMPMYKLIEYSDNYSDTSGSQEVYRSLKEMNLQLIILIWLLIIITLILNHLNIKQLL